jgi:hypothetical protein
MHAFYTLFALLPVAIFAISSIHDPTDALAERTISNNGEFSSCKLICFRKERGDMTCIVESLLFGVLF